ncbi:NTE family protein [Tahibacter aquaticus]|uniref:NTE family protein n=2 Tax=Tahibacter aquaticus TaxID=520092 RepID=A0A4R6YPM4_9GAMM|nr:NTE family protein [Tahibacter aquaticus]
MSNANCGLRKPLDRAASRGLHSPIIPGADASPMPPTASRGLRKNYDGIALVLQGGGALGAYQAGVYEELHKTEYQPDWIAGVSIGAINAALIAGNPPEHRLQRLHDFWQQLSSHLPPLLDSDGFLSSLFGDIGHRSRSQLNQFSALWSAMLGVPGFYQPRLPPAWLYPDGDASALSLYDNSALRQTLETYVDFDLINARRVRLSVGAVNVRTGNSVYFDNHHCRIGPQHILASGALPPAFAPVEIDGEAYWDGGIVSNTPLQYLLDERAGKSLLVLQVDLFSARGALPRNLTEVAQRQKDILYSSRTRYNSSMAAQIANTRQAARNLLARLPQELRENADFKLLDAALDSTRVDIVQLIYRQKPYELESKDYEFSRTSVKEHWEAGRRDMCDTIQHPEWLKSSGLDDGVTLYDLAHRPPV